MAELQRFYYDVAQIAHPVPLAALAKIVPVSQILWGTDFPFRLGSEYVKALGGIRVQRWRPAQDRA